jgi:hypothetical protein
MSLVGLCTAKLERRRSFWVDLSRNILLILFTNWIGLSSEHSLPLYALSIRLEKIDDMISITQ